MAAPQIFTLAELKASGYQPKSIKDELRDNLIVNLKAQKNSFEGIIGFDDTVIPDIERAILSKHNILLLGLRGQAKTRIARLLVQLLDEYIPVVKDSPLNDDPLQPLSRFALDLIEECGDQTPITWLHRDERYIEKLATPDVSVADLIGDVDPIKAATLKLSYSDQRVIHFGLIPRAHRCLFVINELPDLQARIQVSLFNILQEGDIQIRGFKLRLPLDIQFLATANPEDYTNRGSIITPLKDRIESQILTHYPRDIETALKITKQEIKPLNTDLEIAIDPIMDRMLELIAFKARESELIDEKSGVSARLSISAYENLRSTIERRMLLNNESKAAARITDFWGVIPAVTGKVELLYEGEQAGPYSVAIQILDEVTKQTFLESFPHPEKTGQSDNDLYGVLRAYFSDGNAVQLLNDESSKTFNEKLDSVPGLKQVANHAQPTNDQERYLLMELVLQGLSAFNVLSKSVVDSQITFNDDLASMFGSLEEDDDQY